jgi:hypothetical protein
MITPHALVRSADAALSPIMDEKRGYRKVTVTAAIGRMLRAAALDSSIRIAGFLCSDTLVIQCGTNLQSMRSSNCIGLVPINALGTADQEFTWPSLAPLSARGLLAG